MTIYEIDEQMTNLIDEETGEIIDFSLFENLNMARTEKIENLCLLIKNLKAEAKAIKEEKDLLGKRQKVAENKVKNLTGFLNKILNGEKFKTPKVNVTYRASESVRVTDDFVEWAKVNAPELLTVKEPEPNKAEIKKAIKAGTEFEFAMVENNQSIQIK